MSNVADNHQSEVVRARVAEILAALSTSFGAGVRVTATGELETVDIEGWLWLCQRDLTVVRASVDDPGCSGAGLLFAIDTVDAINLAGRMMMAPDEVIEEQRVRGDLTGGYSGAFAEVAHLMCCDVEGALRRSRGEATSLRITGFGSIRPGFDLDSILGAGERTIFGFELQVNGRQPTLGSIIFDLDLAVAWNDGASCAGAENDFEAGEGELPDTPICANVAAYLVSREALAVLQSCGRRLGLDVRPRPRTEIPNPDAHRGEIVLIEVPVGHTRRFDWARRIKQTHADIPVMLLIHEPSHALVRQGFLTKADVVAAWPCTEKQISQKISPLLIHLLA